MMTDYRHILIIKPSSLGDIVHAMPAVSALRQTFPQARLTWLVKKQWAPLVERIDGVDRVWPVDAGLWGWLSQVPGLRREHFDVAVDLQGLFRSAAMGWLSGVPARIGFANAREGAPRWYSQEVAVPSPDMHAVDRYLLVTDAMGCGQARRPEFRFRIMRADRDAVDRLLEQQGMMRGTPWIAMNVSARWPTKRWPAESFAAVADRLQREGLGRVVLIGGPDERPDAAAVQRAMKERAIDLTGQTALGQLPALLSQATVLITNDSGPLHIAAAVGTPVVALFGPTSPVRTGPYGAGHQVLTHHVSCSPCFSRSCFNREPLACLTHVTPDQVCSAVKLHERRPVANPS